MDGEHGQTFRLLVNDMELKEQGILVFGVVEPMGNDPSRFMLRYSQSQAPLMVAGPVQAEVKSAMITGMLRPSGNNQNPWTLTPINISPISLPKMPQLMNLLDTLSRANPDVLGFYSRQDKGSRQMAQPQMQQQNIQQPQMQQQNFQQPQMQQQNFQQPQMQQQNIPQPQMQQQNFQQPQMQQQNFQQPQMQQQNIQQPQMQQQNFQQPQMQQQTFQQPQMQQQTFQQPQMQQPPMLQQNIRPQDGPLVNQNMYQCQETVQQPAGMLHGGMQNSGAVKPVTRNSLVTSNTEGPNEDDELADMFGF